ncbi:hypothetical protein BU17DRAFT_65687 [Hysterangium stoloniferum]|nr:hypothetical protein BU17DRAFT_65687 [Hysterangium stoloniferum]
MATQRWPDRGGRGQLGTGGSIKMSYIATEVVAINLEQAVPKEFKFKLYKFCHKFCPRNYLVPIEEWLRGDNEATSLHRRLDRPDKVTKLSTLSADVVKTWGDNETMKRTRLRARLRIGRRFLPWCGVLFSLLLTALLFLLPPQPCKGTDKISVVTIT